MIVTFLVDSNVLSEPIRPQPDARVIEWLRENESELVISPIVLGEIEYGIVILPAGRRRERLMDWFIERVKGLRIVDLDAATASIWANLMARLHRKGWAMPANDSLIAATALRHNLTIATRNTADFKNAGVPLVNPFDV